MSSAFTVINYGATGGFPSANDPGPSVRGNQFFAGGYAALSTATQTIDVSASASDINTETALVDFSGWLGGFASDTDTVTLSVAFFKGNTNLGGRRNWPGNSYDRHRRRRSLRAPVMEPQSAKAHCPATRYQGGVLIRDNKPNRPARSSREKKIKTL